MINGMPITNNPIEENNKRYYSYARKNKLKKCFCATCYSRWMSLEHYENENISSEIGNECEKPKYKECDVDTPPSTKICKQFWRSCKKDTPPGGWQPEPEPVVGEVLSDSSKKSRKMEDIKKDKKWPWGKILFSVLIVNISIIFYQYLLMLFKWRKMMKETKTDMIETLNKYHAEQIIPVEQRRLVSYNKKYERK
jgi:hypothetical protein